MGAMDPPITRTNSTADEPLLEDGTVGGPGDVELTTMSGLHGGIGLGARGSNSSGGAREVGAPVAQCGGTLYLVYCIFCCALTATLLVITLWEGSQPRREASFWRRKLRPWEEAGEAFVGTALCTETLMPMLALGARRYLRDRWRFLDVAVACLTLVCGVFFMFRRAIHHAGDLVEDIDVPILALRFALQPLRMVSTASMVVRARRRVHVKRDEPPPIVDPRRPSALLRSALTVEMAAELRDFLPSYLRFNEWTLVYSPQLHGTSINTFYRQQIGPNLLVVQDAQGGIFGGFATETWRPQNGAYGHGEGFVFVARRNEDDAGARSRSASVCSDDGSPCSSPCRQSSAPDFPVCVEMTSMDSEKSQNVQVFWAVPLTGRIIQWSNSNMLGFGRAVTLCDDFIRGASERCDAYESPPLSLPANGGEFIVRSLECWYVGPDRD